MHSCAKKIGASSIAVAALAQLMMPQAAMACDLHGEFGFNRLNPFIAMRHRHMETHIPEQDDATITSETEQPNTVSGKVIEQSADNKERKVAKPSQIDSKAVTSAENDSGQS
ncbi:MAG: hypothetical protein AAGH53_13705 [Pseudomonadota bacterium]